MVWVCDGSGRPDKNKDKWKEGGGGVGVGLFAWLISPSG